MIFRIDDVNGGTDAVKLWQMIRVIREMLPNANIVVCISPLYTNTVEERVFPQIFKAYSDHKVFFQVDRCFVPKFPNDIKKEIIIASHGLIHVDHRLLGREGQEMSIVVAANLVKSSIFCPPFHKYNQDTIDICKQQGIKLLKWEDGWKHVVYNRYDPSISYWYIHPFDKTPEELRRWFNHENG